MLTLGLPVLILMPFLPRTLNLLQEDIPQLIGDIRVALLAFEDFLEGAGDIAELKGEHIFKTMGDGFQLGLTMIEYAQLLQGINQFDKADLGMGPGKPKVFGKWCSEGNSRNRVYGSAD